MPLQKPTLLHHLQVVLGALADAVGLENPPLRFDVAHLGIEFGAQLDDGALDRRCRGDVLGGGEDRDRVESRQRLAGERIEVRDRFDLVAEERDPPGGLGVGGLQLEHVAAHAEPSAAEHGVVAHVLDVDQLAQHLVAIVLLTGGERDDALAVLLGRPEPVDARDRRDDHDVAA